MKKVIKIGFCVAYDWLLLKNSLPLVYEEADLICLSIDKDRRSWAGTQYEFDEEGFRNFVKETDTTDKIIIYEDDFCRPGNSTMENDNLQRNLMAQRMGEGGWHLQIDSDEYLIGFKKLVQYLKKLNPCPNGSEKPFNVSVNMIPIFKKDDSGYYIIDFGKNDHERFPVVTTKPKYEWARLNGYFNHHSHFFAIHETWARGEEELWYKINSWGHSNVELSKPGMKESFFKLWKSIDEYNYKCVKNIHPIKSNIWPALNYVAAKSIPELVEKLKEGDYLKANKSFGENNRNISRVKHFFKKYF